MRVTRPIADQHQAFEFDHQAVIAPRALRFGSGFIASCDWVEIGCCWDRERMSGPGWTVQRIDEDGRRAVSGAWTYERDSRGAPVASARDRRQSSGAVIARHKDPEHFPIRLANACFRPN